MPPVWTAFTDSDSKYWSWSRLMCGAIVFFDLVWGCYIVWFNKAIPDFTSSALLIGAIYGINRYAEIKENEPPPQPQQPPQPQTQNVNIETS